MTSSVQLIKGGFSYRAKHELDWPEDIWQAGFSDHRIRDLQDFCSHKVYIELDPVRAHLCANISEYRYSSLTKTIDLDDVPQRLKPETLSNFDGGAEALPLQAEAHPFQAITPHLHAEALPFQTKTSRVHAEVQPLKSRVFKNSIGLIAGEQR